jgi:glycine cleavage system aminomethyltransferase T
MSDSRVTEEASVKQPTLPLAETIPPNPHARNYTRFLADFEVSEFTDWIDESLSWKKSCYIGDWSQCLKLRVRGPEALAFLEYLSTNTWPDFKQYTAKHSIMCRGDGKVVGEGLIMKLADDDYLYTSGPGIPWAEFQFQHGRRKYNCNTELVTRDWYLIQVQGPDSIAVMEAVTGTEITDLKFLYAKWMSINGMKFLALRQGVSGERGYELWGPAKDGQAVWKAIVEAGQGFGIRQLGMRTKLVNHVSWHKSQIFFDYKKKLTGK